MAKTARAAKNAGKKLVLLGISLLVALTLVEILLRVVGYSPAVSSPLNAFHEAHERLGWVGTPNHTSRFKTLNFDAIVETDTEGFRINKSSVSPDENAPEVWILGDSTVWGWGVSNEEMFSSILQEEAGPGVRIRNFAMNAYGTLQEALLLEKLLSEKEPPAKVILMVCSNDFTDNLTDKGGARPFVKLAEPGQQPTIGNQPVERKIGGKAATLKRHSHAITFLSYCTAVVKQIRKRRQHDDMFDSSWKKQADRVPKGRAKKPLPDDQIEGMRFAFEKIDALCDQHEIEWNVISFPSATTGFAKPAQTLALEEIVEDLDAELVDILSGMSENRREYYIGKGDFHWNAAGNRKAAEVLVERLGPNLGL
ncbi:MAG: SGNH/GDSL hydrolase family protein [Verrucomicrobiales bacterium]